MQLTRSSVRFNLCFYAQSLSRKDKARILSCKFTLANIIAKSEYMKNHHIWSYIRTAEYVEGHHDYVRNLSTCWNKAWKTIPASTEEH